MNPYQRLDHEHRGRINEIATRWANDEKLDFEGICHGAGITSTIPTQKVILPSFDTRRIFLNYPFAECMYVVVCPKCITSAECRTVAKILHESDIIPVLVGDYADYPEEYIKEVLPVPHISTHEFHFLRYVLVLQQGDTNICNHCVEEARGRILKKLEKADLPPRGDMMVDQVLRNLYPFIEPDFEMIDILEGAVQSSNKEGILCLAGSSEAICEIRTSTAFNARCLLPTGEIPRLLENASEVVDVEAEMDIATLANTIERAPHFELPEQVDTAEFFECARRYRETLAPIIDSLTTAAKDNGELSLTKLSSCVQNLNADVRKLERSKRYLVYRGGVGFLQSNKALVASALVGGILGLTTGMLGCGVSIVAGAVVDQVRKRKGGIKVPPEAEKLGIEVEKSIRPILHKILAKYTGASLPAVQLHEISQAVTKNKKP